MDSNNEKQEIKGVTTLTSEQLQIFKTVGCIQHDTHITYFLPYGLKQVGEDKYELVPLDKLPGNIKVYIDERINPKQEVIKP